MRHLRNAESLARQCLELVVDLLPDGDEMASAEYAREKAAEALKTIRAIQLELDLGIAAVIEATHWDERERPL